MKFVKVKVEISDQDSFMYKILACILNPSSTTLSLWAKFLTFLCLSFLICKKKKKKKRDHLVSLSQNNAIGRSKAASWGGEQELDDLGLKGRKGQRKLGGAKV